MSALPRNIAQQRGHREASAQADYGQTKRAITMMRRWRAANAVGCHGRAGARGERRVLRSRNGEAPPYAVRRPTLGNAQVKPEPHTQICIKQGFVAAQDVDDARNAGRPYSAGALDVANGGSLQGAQAAGRQRRRRSSNSAQSNRPAIVATKGNRRHRGRAPEGAAGAGRACKLRAVANQVRRHPPTSPTCALCRPLSTAARGPGICAMRRRSSPTPSCASPMDGFVTAARRPIRVRQSRRERSCT